MRLNAKSIRPRSRFQVLTAAALLAALSTGLTSPAFAQEEAPETAPEAAAAAAPAEAKEDAAELSGTPEQRAAAEELLKASSVDQMITESFDNVLAMQMRNMQGMQIPEDKKEKFAELQKRSGEIIKEELSWAKIKEDVISTYVETFTEEEIKGLVEFYNGPLGKKLIEKQPVLMQKTMKLAERQMAGLRPRLTALAGEIMGPIPGGPGAGGPMEETPAPPAGE